jgi:hypothetical protein
LNSHFYQHKEKPRD